MGDKPKEKEPSKDYIEELRQRCLERGSHGIKGFARLFRIMDDNGDKKLNMEEFTKGLHDYGFKDINAEDAKQMFQQIDKDGSGTLDFNEFLESLRPPMSDSRIEIIDKAFKKLDRTGDGVVTVEDLQGVYSPDEHKKYKEGTWTKEQVFEEFLKTFDSPNDPDGKVTKEEFINYYSGVSANIDQDSYFDLMMRKAWKL